MVRLLLAAGADVGRVDADGENALHKASIGGAATTAAVLLAACPDAANAVDRRGRTPAERAPDDATRRVFAGSLTRPTPPTEKGS